MTEPALPLRGIHLSVIVPMYNEARRIGPTLAQMGAFLREAPFSSEIIAVDDGSSDGCGQLASEILTAQTGGNLLRGAVETHDHNRGKGAAVRTGLARSRGEWSLLSDADASTPVSEVLKLLDAARNQEVALVLGSRAVRGAKVTAMPHRILAGRIFQWIARRHGFTGVADSQCGFKLYRADLATHIARESLEDGYIADIEHIALARLAGFGVAEVGVRWRHRFGGKVSLIRDALRMWHDLGRLTERIQRLRIRETPG